MYLGWECLNLKYALCIHVCIIIPGGTCTGQLGLAHACAQCTTLISKDTKYLSNQFCIKQIIIFKLSIWLYMCWLGICACAILTPPSLAPSPLPPQCSANLVHPCICKEQRWIISRDGGGTGHIGVLLPQKIVKEDPSDLFASQWGVHSEPLSCQGERMDTPLQSCEAGWALDRKRS